MALGIYLNATTGGTNGTLEVPGDGSGITVGAIGDVQTFHLRAASGYQNAEQVTVTAPAGCHVSTNGTDYASTAVYAVGDIDDTNTVCYIKRVSGTTASTTGLVTTPRLALITSEAIPDTTSPTLSGTLAATAGDTQATLSGPTASDNVGIAKWQYRIGAGAWVDIAASNNTTMPSTVVGSLTNGTEYSFTVRAVDAATNASSASNAATATPVASIAWSDDFADSSVDTAKWFTRTQDGGTVTETGGNIVINTNDTAAKLAMLVSKGIIHTDQNGRLTATGPVIASTSHEGITRMAIVSEPEPVFGASTGSIWLASVILVSMDLTANTCTISMWGSTGTRYYWTGSAWSTTASSVAYAWDAGDTFTFILNVNATGGTWTCSLYEGANLVTTTAAYNIADTRGGSSNWYASLHDNSASVKMDIEWSNITYEAT